MKIMAISDLHGKINKSLEKYLEQNKIDLLIISGDISNFGPTQLIQDNLNKISTYNTPIIAIPGNCDPQDTTDAINNSQAQNAHKENIKIENIIITGFGGSNPTPFDTPTEYTDEELYTQLDTLIKQTQVEKENIHILLTHAPPLNTKADEIPDGAHVGSEAVRKIIEKYQPDINLCGHIHEAKSIDKIGKTTILNPGEMANSHASIIEIDENNNITCEIIKI